MFVCAVFQVSGHHLDGADADDSPEYSEPPLDNRYAAPLLFFHSSSVAHATYSALFSRFNLFELNSMDVLYVAPAC